MSAITADRGGVLVRCPSCGKMNRVRYAALSSKNQCGSCRTPLSPPRTPVEISDATTFDLVIQSSALPVLVDFWAPWCGPCRVVGPVLEEIAGERDDLKIVKLNTDENPQVSAQFQVLSIPTLILFKNGEAVKKVIGAYPKRKLEAELEPALA